eukprot:UN07860
MQEKHEFSAQKSTETLAKVRAEFHTKEENYKTKITQLEQTLKNLEEEFNGKCTDHSNGLDAMRKDHEEKLFQ